MKEFTIDSDGIALHAKLEMPEGVSSCPLAIIVHGLTGNMEEEHIRAMAKGVVDIGIAALRVEMYGHGKSGGAFDDHTIYKWVGNMLKAIEYAKSLDFVTDLYLMGHSQGGLLTVLMGGMRNDDLKAIIPLSPALNIPDMVRTKGLLLGVPFDPEHIPEHFDSDWIHVKGDYIRTMQTIHAEEAIDRYKGRVLIVHGDEDMAVPVSYGIEAAKRYQNAKLVILKGDDHGYHKHLDEAVKAVQDFLRS